MTTAEIVKHLKRGLYPKLTSDYVNRVLNSKNEDEEEGSL